MLIGKLKLDRNLLYFLTLIIVSLPLLVATPATGNPFGDEPVCPRFSCDVNGNCTKIDPPLPCAKEEIRTEISRLDEQIARARIDMARPEYSQEQRAQLQSQIDFWETQKQQLLQELNK
jgi:hypothetical protein